MTTGNKLKVFINKIFKDCNFDTKEKGTEQYICARDMSHIAHVQRSKMLLSLYLEGVKDTEVLYRAIWHLACGLVRYHEEMGSKRYSARGIEITGTNSPDASYAGVDGDPDSRQQVSSWIP